MENGTNGTIQGNGANGASKSLDGAMLAKIETLVADRVQSVGEQLVQATIEAVITHRPTLSQDEIKALHCKAIGRVLTSAYREEAKRPGLIPK